MAEDLGIEAKETAVREVAKLLPLPELLQSIVSIKADYITRQQVTSIHSFFLSIFLWISIQLNCYYFWFFRLMTRNLVQW